MSKPKKDDKLNELTGNRLNKAIIAKYGKKDLVSFMRDLDFAGHKISKIALSRTINGHNTLTRQKVDWYAPILGVNSAWLLGLDGEYRTENDKVEDKQTISQILESVAEEICQNYCKWPEKWDEEMEGCELSESSICQNCPLNKLV